jgi:hypothetical protein
MTDDDQTTQSFTPVIRLFWDFYGPDAAETAQHHKRHVEEFFRSNQVPFRVGITERDRAGTTVSVFFDSDRFPQMLRADLSSEQMVKHDAGESPEEMIDRVGQALRPTRYEVLV